MGDTKIREDLKKLTHITDTALIDPASLQDDQFRNLVVQYEKIAHSLFYSRTASLMQILNNELTDEKFTMMVKKLADGDKLYMLLTLQRARLKEYESISYIVKNIANIADIMRKAQMSADNDEILAATAIDLKIVKLLIRCHRWLKYEDKRDIYNYIKQLVIEKRDEIREAARNRKKGKT